MSYGCAGVGGSGVYAIVFRLLGFEEWIFLVITAASVDIVLPIPRIASFRFVTRKFDQLDFVISLSLLLSCQNSAELERSNAAEREHGARI